MLSAPEGMQRGQEGTGTASETQGWCMCENDRLVWEADIGTEVIRYLDVMLNMLALSACFSPVLPYSFLPFRLILFLSALLFSQLANSTYWAKI